MSDRALELDDIQGNVLAGFNTDIQILVGLTVVDNAGFPAAARWLATQAPAVSTVADVRGTRTLMKSAPADPGTTWLCIAISQRLLGSARPDVTIRDEAFRGGMLKRGPSVLGDKTDSKGWEVGGKAPLDVLLIIGANHENAAEERADGLAASAEKAGLARTYRETARRLDDDEHFGFRDGISQPGVAGFDRRGALGAGHFVFGYPKQPGGDPFSPVIDADGVTDNGSLLVFRRLQQHVERFRDFCAAEASRLAPEWPGLDKDHLAALLVGRWPSGAPAKISESRDPGGSPPDDNFDFHDDPEGQVCPFAAHIRKVNPRNGPKDVVDTPRMLRRGIPFGPRFRDSPETPRGLIFLAFQSSIKAQFEFLTQHWMNSPDKPRPGHDLLVGREDGVRSMTIRGPNGEVTLSHGGEQWITPTGGGYLFAPGRKGLAKLAEPPSLLNFGRVRRLWADAVDAVTAPFER
jgi:Dyp-type peroxidase family